MLQKIEIDRYSCDGVRHPASEKVTYMIYPQVEGLPAQWMERMSSAYATSIIVVYVPADCWDNVLTPWPAPPVPKGSQPFAGEAPEFYAELSGRIIPMAEKSLGIDAPSERNLIGVSLAGLFTLWQWMQFDLFASVGCLSGSFWYEGFLEWFESRAVLRKSGMAYFLLGNEEPKTRVKGFQSVGVNTEKIVAHLKSAGINCRFDWVPGNHFADPLQRAEKALAALSLSSNQA